MKYEVEGTITFDVTVEVEAESQAEAKVKAAEIINDFYHLDTNGAHHFPSDVKMDLYAYEEED